MKKWYKQPYFDKKNWILDNFNKLNLTAEETLLLLLIEFAKENDIALSYDYLCTKMSRSNRELDEILSRLVGKHYLKISSGKRGISFNIDEVFEFDVEKYELAESGDAYSTLDMVFGRPLSPSELQKASDLMSEFSKEQFMDALRIADAKRILKMSYIEGILRNSEKDR